MGLEVLPRLTDGGYDLVLVDASPADHPRYLDEALRLLRPGGVAGAARRARRRACSTRDAADASTLALREVTRQVRDDERLAPTLLPLGEACWPRSGLTRTCRRARRGRCTVTSRPAATGR